VIKLEPLGRTLNYLQGLEFCEIKYLLWAGPPRKRALISIWGKIFFSSLHFAGSSVALLFSPTALQSFFRQEAKLISRSN
jgi:hypothetical protein